MARGRPRQHPTLREAEGAYRKDPQLRPTHLIEVAEGTPEPTLLISGCELSKKIWDETVATLTEIDLINKTDRFLLEAFCLNLRELYSLTSIIQVNGHYQQDENGRKTDPVVVSYHKVMATHIKLLNELGLTPQARLRMIGPSEKKDDTGVADLMKRLSGGS